MLKDITIERFRGMRACHVQNLSRVNLFFGKNNCGKTSLLESVFLLSGQMNPALSVSVNNIRSGRSLMENDVPVLFYNGEIEKPISLSSETEVGKRSLVISALRSEMQQLSQVELLQTASGLNQRYGYHYTYFDGKSQGEASIEFEEDGKDTPNLGRLKTSNGSKDDFFCRYLPAQYSLMPNLVDEYSDLLKAKKEGDLFRALRTIEPRLADIVIVGKDLMVDVGGTCRLPLYVLGDGIRKYLRIIIGIHAAKDGAFLIDEIENGLHYSALKDLWRIILRESELYNVQVFVTTHDRETIAALAGCIGEEFSKDVSVSAYKLLKQSGGEVKALMYDKDQLTYMMNQNIEVR